ncbi:MAG: hypothetical protein OXC81_05225 [Betaproteobacteria bacterium]|nr:hypothetical protein [Betaproteobacteria bacterium]
MPGNPAGILLLTHASLGRHLHATAEQLMPCRIEGVKILGIGSANDLAKLRSSLTAAMAELARQHEQVLVMCDTFGATASRLLSENPPVRPRLHFVYGVNLPMLLEALGQRNSLEVASLAEQVCKIGRESIFAANAKGSQAPSP